MAPKLVILKDSPWVESRVLKKGELLAHLWVAMKVGLPETLMVGKLVN